MEIVHYIFVEDANFPNLHEGAVSPRHVEGAVFTEGVPNSVRGGTTDSKKNYVGGI